jgi:hypothetical protein
LHAASYGIEVTEVPLPSFTFQKVGNGIYLKAYIIIEIGQPRFGEGCQNLYRGIDFGDELRKRCHFHVKPEQPQKLTLAKASKVAPSELNSVSTITLVPDTGYFAFRTWTSPAILRSSLDPKNKIPFGSGTS